VSEWFKGPTWKVGIFARVSRVRIPPSPPSIMIAQSISQLLENKKVIVFDFDGTLVDTMGVYSKLVEEILLDYPDLDLKSELRKFIETSGLPFSTQLELMFPDTPKSFKEEVASAFEKQKAIVVKELELEDSVRAALVRLKERGLKLALSSSTHQELVESALFKYGLFDLILGYRNLDFGKGKAHFDEILDNFGVGKNDLIFVGDSLKDYEIANEYGVDFVGKIGTFTRERFIVLNENMVLINEISDLV
jgi:phosphoglycolate phosphatase-like HAD superfamily hydrolase